MVKRNEGSKCLIIPQTLHHLCNFIQINGMMEKKLYNTSSTDEKLEYFKSCFEHIEDASLETEGNVLLTAELLKLFLLEFATPIIPPTTYTAFTTALNGINREECIKNLKQILQTIPKKNYTVVKYISQFLHKMTCFQQTNKLNAFALGNVFGPLLFRTPIKTNSWRKLMKDEITMIFISDYYNIFGYEDMSVVDTLFQETDKSSNIIKQNIEKKKIPTVSSPVMPFLPLEPLSVIIPPIDDQLLSLTSTQLTELSDGEIPVLIINNSLINSDIIIPEKLVQERYSSILGRKRKERRPSGDELHPIRSSSEERPPYKRDEELLISDKEQMKRFNSNEEVRIISEQEIDESFQMKPNIEGHSPHPPKPKRREIDQNMTGAFNKKPSEYDRSLQQEYILNDLCLLDDYNDDNMKTSNSNTQSSNVRKIITSNNHGKKDIVNKTESKDSKSLCWMNNSAETILNSDDEKSDSLKENIIQKQSKDESYCTKNDIQTDRVFQEKHSSQSDKNEQFPSLDLSSLNDHEYEPILSGHVSWPLLKVADDDDDDNAVLSPSVFSLRKTSSYEAPLSPSAYKSYLSHRSLHLDPTIPPSPPAEQDDFCKSLKEEDATANNIKQLNKRIQNIKKKLKLFDESFEEEHGYKPSHAEKMNFSEIKKLISHLNKARKDLKVLKEGHNVESTDLPIPTRQHWFPTRDIHILEDTTNSGGVMKDAICKTHANGIEKKLKPSIEASLDEAMKNLCDKRKFAQRPEIMEDMTNEQVMDEKLALQKALLQLESIHGRPTNKLDRDIMRPLYDRYRIVKRLLNRPNISTNLTSKDTGTELQPILEHVAMDFISPQNSLKDEFPVCQESLSEPMENTNEERSEWTDHLSVKYNSSNLHELPFSELLFQQQTAKLEKRRLRVVLREFEEKFQQQTGRKVQKEDRIPMEVVYGEYKHVKGRLRLLDALVSKHESRK